MSNVLVEWYLECFGVKIPEYQYTQEDNDFATRWLSESMDYSTKILLPVVQQLLTTRVPTVSHAIVPVLPFTLSQQKEDICATWGGRC